MKSHCFHRDVLILTREATRLSYADESVKDWVQIELASLRKYLAWVKSLQQAEKTGYQEDEEILARVQADKKKWHWMYQFVLIYRIEQKKIVQSQILLTLLLISRLEAFDEGKGTTVADFLESDETVKLIMSSSNSMLDYFQKDLVDKEV